MSKRTVQNKDESNRSNALKSTGPRTAKGKEIVAANATKHGLMARRAVIEGESQAEYDAFCAATFDDRSPVGMMEHELTDIIASSFWRLRRIKRIEVELLDSFTDTPPPSPGKENKLPFTVIIRKTYTGLPPEDEPEADNSPNCHPERSDAESRDLSKQESSALQNRLSLGHAFVTDTAAGNALTKLQRYEAHVNRTLYKAMAELNRLQRERRSQIDIDQF